MKQKLSLGIIALVMMSFTTSPAKAVSPTLQSIVETLGALQNSVNTLQNSVNNMPPAWYQVLPSDQRFLLVLGGEGVLDRETGLVWQRSPSTDKYDWNMAQIHCNLWGAGGRLGWRLPTVQELASLHYPPEGLPPGHPFINLLQTPRYWSSNTRYNEPESAWFISFDTGGLQVEWKTNNYWIGAWCVRGGSGVDPQ